ncbi:hypothetical protein M422DRAFT_274610 [Sphaerobolus stellatus SS14]|uniref:Uncharacterized protein n=1 Tax=Sphaerobolus stellatus (strain SS14) TaxID=990650 RepID=A0A0C9T6K8_SPHS4|nr:hypothetical protein M422DRAFT_274610 [Sphaerobolus stellatus SS14]
MALFAADLITVQFRVFLFPCLPNPNKIDAGNILQSLIQKKALAMLSSKTSASDASVSHGGPTKRKQNLQTVSDNDDSDIEEIALPPPKKAKSKDAAIGKCVEMEKMNDDSFLQDLDGHEDIRDDTTTESRTQDVNHFFITMSMHCNHKWVEELSAPAVGEDEPIPGLTAGELMDPSPSSVDPQQSSEVFMQEHPGDLSMRAHGSQTVPVKVQSPIGTASAASTSAPSQHQSRVAKASGTATPGQDSPRGIISGSDSGHNLSGAPDESDHAPLMQVVRKMRTVTLQLKLENSEIVLLEAMEATELLNTVFNQIRTSMNRMSPTMKDIFLVPKRKSSEKTIEPGNNWARDKAAAKAATERIVMQGATSVPITGTQQEERMRLVQSCREWESDENSPSPRRLNIHKNIHSTALSEQSEDSQQCGRDAHTAYACSTCDERVTNQSRTRQTHDIRVTEDTHANFQESVQRRHRRDTSPINTWWELGIPESIEHSWHSIKETQSIDMNALREEIKETISAAIKEKLHSDADSVTTVSHSMTALDANAQYWSDLSNKVVHRSHRALELQLKMAEEKVNTLLYEEAPEEALLEAAREVHHILTKQLSQKSCIVITKGFLEHIALLHTWLANLPVGVDEEKFWSYADQKLKQYEKDLTPSAYAEKLRGILAFDTQKYPREPEEEHIPTVIVTDSQIPASQKTCMDKAKAKVRSGQHA